MPPAISQPHDKDLERRFFDIDYVSEFQKYWAMFNKWFKSETSINRDRDAIELLKGNDRLTAAFKSFAYFFVDPFLVDNLTYGQKDYYFYSGETFVSSFFKACWLDPTVQSHLNLFNPNPSNGIRGTATIHLTLDQFRSLYSRGKESSINYMYLDQPSVKLILSYVSIGHTGSVFYKDQSVKSMATHEQDQQLTEIWKAIAGQSSLKILSDLKNSSICPGYFADTIETLYLVRNLAVHGELDYLNEQNNTTARTALIVLNELIKNILK